MSDNEMVILFAQTNELLFSADETETNSFRLSRLHRILVDLGCKVNCSSQFPDIHQLANVHVLVIGISGQSNEIVEVETVSEFLESGGGVLLLGDAQSIIGPEPRLNNFAKLAGLRFDEYLNTQPSLIQVFCPHYITGNLRRVRVDKRVAAVKILKDAHALAFTKATKETIAACNKVGSGQMVVVGNIGWLTDICLSTEDNEIFVTNIFRWLLQRNIVDIESVTVPRTIFLGQTGTVSLELHNTHAIDRPEVRCRLESDKDAFISQSGWKNRSVPPETTTFMQWVVRPRVLGEQKLRLSIIVDDEDDVFFDNLEDVNCLAPGYFTFKVKNEDERQQVRFETGDHFSVEGVFHWTTDIEDPPKCNLTLTHGDGLVDLQGHELGNGVGRWHLRAATPGEHELLLCMAETGQSLSAIVTVNSALADRLLEIKIAYVYPLEAAIVARLKQIDQAFASPPMQSQAFEILLPEEFAKRLYKSDVAIWLCGALAAARREQWPNRELMEIVLQHIRPVYVVNKGAFIPFDPTLANHLSWLHHEERRYIEYNFLCFDESEGINVKQRVATSLLHEKYGHGFFYTQTHLGQQLALLDDQPMLEETAKLVDDSAIIVNEGFAAWLELTFLKKLDHEVRQAFDLRYIMLIDEGPGLFDLAGKKGSFFNTFVPRFDSRYREGYEYLDFIGTIFNLRCAISMFLLSTDVDLGISLDDRGDIVIDEVQVRERLLSAETHKWRSHFRLRKIAELLRDYKDEAKALVQKRYCPLDCQQRACPLERFVIENIDWRQYEKKA